MKIQEAVVLPKEYLSRAASAEQRVVLHGIRWQTYEDLLAQNEGNSAVHFAYDRGNLEIMTLSPRHEILKHTLSLLVEVLAEEFGIDILGLGSTTFRQHDLERGFEPDACFYISNVDSIRAREAVDLLVDPPPDLVIEIDISHPSLNKFPIFHAMRIPEIWRYDGELVTVYQWQVNGYESGRNSVVFPIVTTQLLAEWMDTSSYLKRNLWLRQVRSWARTVASR